MQQLHKQYGCVKIDLVDSTILVSKRRHSTGILLTLLDRSLSQESIGGLPGLSWLQITLVRSPFEQLSILRSESGVFEADPIETKAHPSVTELQTQVRFRDEAAFVRHATVEPYVSIPTPRTQYTASKQERSRARELRESRTRTRRPYPTIDARAGPSTVGTHCRETPRRGYSTSAAPESPMPHEKKQPPMNSCPRFCSPSPEIRLATVCQQTNDSLSGRHVAPAWCPRRCPRRAKPSNSASRGGRNSRPRRGYRKFRVSVSKAKRSECHGARR